MQPRSRQRRARAFTLVEAISTIVILAVVMSVSSKLIFAAADSYAGTTARAQLASDLSAALDLVTLHLREIEPKATPGAPAPSIGSIAAGSIIFNEDWSFTLSGGTLWFTENGGQPRALLAGVTAFEIEAFNDAGASLGGSLSGSQCDAVQRLGIALTASRAGVTERLSTRVFLRCRAGG